MNPRALEWGIYCTDAGCNSVGSGDPYPPYPDTHPRAYWENVSRHRVLNEYQIVYITRGGGRFECAPGCSLPIRAGDLFLLFPGVWHAYSPSTEVGWDEYWVGFSGPHARSLQRRRFISPREPVHSIGLRKDLLNDFYEIFEGAERQSPGFQLQLGATIMTIVAKVIGAACEVSERSPGETLVERAKFFMEENLHRDLDVADLCGELSLSYSSILKLFKEHAGLAPHHYFLQMKIDRAKELLCDGGASVKEVAFRLGFENEYYFSRLFRKKTGASPSRWRELSADDSVLR